MRKKLVIPIFLIIPILFLFLFSLSGIIGWYMDNNETNSMMDFVEKTVKKKRVPNVGTVVDGANSASDDVLIDFQELKKVNEEVVGWIQVPNTKIDYPVVQHEDNSFYLTHSLNKKKNQAGWVFLDYRNSFNNFHQNTIIYAHGRVDGTMFGSLKELMSKEFLEGNDQFIKLMTESDNYVFQIFSIYVIDTTNDYIETTFEEKTFLNWIQKMQGRSIHSFGIEVNEMDKILTLSTCYNKTQKLVVHAKLLQNKN